LSTLSLADAGALALNRQPLAPRELLDRVATRYTQQAGQKQITLEIQSNGTLPEIKVDEARMMQVLATWSRMHCDIRRRKDRCACPRSARGTTFGSRWPIPARGFALEISGAALNALTGETHPDPEAKRKQDWRWRSPNSS
jgi:hypothetical protein